MFQTLHEISKKKKKQRSYQSALLLASPQIRSFGITIFILAFSKLSQNTIAKEEIRIFHMSSVLAVFDYNWNKIHLYFSSFWKLKQIVSAENWELVISCNSTSTYCLHADSKKYFKNLFSLQLNYSGKYLSVQNLVRKTNNNKNPSFKFPCWSSSYMRRSQFGGGGMGWWSV